MSSEEAAHTRQDTPCPSLPPTLQSFWMRWLQNSKQTPTKKMNKNNEQKKIPGFRQVLAFLHTGSIASPSFRCLVQQDHSAAGASGLAAVSGSAGEASAGFSSPPSAGAASSGFAAASSSAFGSSAAASLAPSSAPSAALASSVGAAAASSDAAAGSPSALASSVAPSSAAGAPSSDSFLVFLKEKPLSLKEGFLKEKRFFFCLPSSLVDGVPSSALAEASPLVAAGSFSPLASAASTFSSPSLGASSVGVLPLAWTSALLASSAAGEASPLVLAWPFS